MTFGGWRMQSDRVSRAYNASLSRLGKSLAQESLRTDGCFLVAASTVANNALPSIDRLDWYSAMNSEGWSILSSGNLLVKTFKALRMMPVGRAARYSSRLFLSHASTSRLAAGHGVRFDGLSWEASGSCDADGLSDAAGGIGLGETVDNALLVLFDALLAGGTRGLVRSHPDLPSRSHFAQGGMPELTHLTLDLLAVPY